MVELDRILSERSDERILAALHAVSDSEFYRFAERVLGYIGLKIMKKRTKGDFIIADCVHRPDGENYVAFLSRRHEPVSKQSVESLVSYMKRVGASKGLVLSSSSIVSGAVKVAEANDVEVADGPKLAALIRRFDLDRELAKGAEIASEHSARFGESEDLEESVAQKMADGFDALSNKNFLKALEYVDQVILSNDDLDTAWRFKATVLDEMGYHEQALECYRHALDINRDSDETWFALANCLFSLSRHEEELKCYSRALALNPLNLKALINKGFTLHRLGRYQEALDVYDEVLRRNYRLEKVHNNRGVTLHRLGRLDDSLEAYDHALALRHGYVEALVNRGNLLVEMERFEDALAAFTQVTEVQPDMPRGWRLRGAVALKLERKSDAKRSFEEALRLDEGDAEAKMALEELKSTADGRFVEAPRLVEEIFSLKAEEASSEPLEPEPAAEDLLLDEKTGPIEQLVEELYGDRAELLLLLGRLDEAHDYLSKSLRLEGENPRLLTAAGNVLFRQGRFEAAIKTYEQAYAADHGFVPALYNLHMALLVAGESEWAVRVSKSLRESSRGWQARAASAIEAVKRKDYNRAIEDVEVALAIENLSTLRNFKGVLQLLSDDYDGAIETFTRLTTGAFDPSEAHNNLGVVILKKGDWEDAGAQFERSMKLRKGNPTAWNNRGCVLYKEERLREAIACFEESLVINPTTVAMNNKGFTQLSLDMLEDAVRSFEQSLKIMETPEAFNSKGIALVRLNRFDEAIVAFREALRIAPEFDDANANLRDALVQRSAPIPEVKEPLPPPPPPPPLPAPVRVKKRVDYNKAKMELLRYENAKTLKDKKKSELEAMCIAVDASSRGTKKELVGRLLKEKRRLLKR
ncbi:MAG: tetratricopeptide repeat protein [Thermoplasmata archaeon]|nr:tetratricopeptide repeat protein [Thermoplasmata archaeon]